MKKRCRRSSAVRAPLRPPDLALISTHKSTLACILVFLLFSAQIAVPAQSVPLQSCPGHKPRLEKFGSSLRKLKWDPSKRTAIASGKKRDTDAKGTAGEAIRLRTLLASFQVLVTDPTQKRAITALSKDDFIISEDDQPQQIATFARGDSAGTPCSVVLLLDASPSQTPYFRASIEAAKMLVSQLGHNDEMAIVSDDVKLIIDFTCDKTKLRSALDSLERQAGRSDLAPLARMRGRSLQFSALFAALRELVTNEEARPIIIFQTDGDEAASFRDQPGPINPAQGWPQREYGLADIYGAAERSRATIYSVVTNERLVGLPPGEMYSRARKMIDARMRAGFKKEEDYRRYSDTHPITDTYVWMWIDLFGRGQSAAARMAELTGGWAAFLEKADDATRIYSQILTDMSNRYLIGYYPTNTRPDGRKRKVKIEVRGHPEYVVHGRQWYYAPSQEE
jgi:VWFA-related protein